MPGKVNIGGTNYSNIAYGKVKISGSDYTINYGKVGLSSGGYSIISFGPIPYSFQQVEYLEVNDAGPYIILPINTVEGLKLKLYCAPLLPEDGGYYDPQCRLGGGSATATIQRFFMDELSDGTFRAAINAQNKTAQSQKLTGSPSSLYYVEADFGYGNTGTMSIIVDNGNTYTGSRSEWMTTGEPMYLFAYKASTISVSEGRFGLVQALNRNNVILMDLYPCYRKSDNVPGFWDTVTKTFLINSGSGSFSVGPDV